MTTYDIAIIGAGINGAGIAYESALQGLKTVLIEKDDISYGTSSRSSRMIHGGLRYLELFEFGLVREALRERELLLRKVPHLIKPLRFIIPIFEGDKRFKLKLGMVLYDLLSYDKSMPSHKSLTRGETIKLEPSLKNSNIKSGFTYYDAVIDFPERLVLENILSAQTLGAKLYIHTEVVNLITQNNRVTGLICKERLEDKTFELNTRFVVNATGPWLDEFLLKTKLDTRKQLRITKGIHLVTPKFTNNALVLRAKSDRRYFFIIPWRDFSLIGTTDTDYDESPDKVRATNDDVKYLVTEVHNNLPAINIEKICYTYAGLRALPRIEGISESNITRKYVLLEHDKTSNLKGLISIIGGKITTYRSLSELVVKKVMTYLGKKWNIQKSSRYSLFNSVLTEPEAGFKKQLITNFSIDYSLADHLYSHYGKNSVKVLEYIHKENELKNRICEHTRDIYAQIIYAIEHESAKTLTDIIARRITIGSDVCLGLHCAEDIARVVSRYANWSEDRIKKEIHEYEEFCHLKEIQ